MLASLIAICAMRVRYNQTPLFGGSWKMIKRGRKLMGVEPQMFAPEQPRLAFPHSSRRYCFCRRKFKFLHVIFICVGPVSNASRNSVCQPWQLQWVRIKRANNSPLCARKWQTVCAVKLFRVTEPISSTLAGIVASRKSFMSCHQVRAPGNTARSTRSARFSLCD